VLASPPLAWVVVSGRKPRSWTGDGGVMASFLSWEHRGWRHGLDVQCCGSPVRDAGPSRGSWAQCTPTLVTPRWWLSRDQLSPSTHSPSPFRHSRVVGASAREVRLKLLLFEMIGVGRDAALMLWSGQVPCVVFVLYAEAFLRISSDVVLVLHLLFAASCSLL
jgi:hypothetical protein